MASRRGLINRVPPGRPGVPSQPGHVSRPGRSDLRAGGLAPSFAFGESNATRLARSETLGAKNMETVSQFLGTARSNSLMNSAQVAFGGKPNFLFAMRPAT